MAISMECQECHRSYKVDDKLGGKTVKCRDCGALIRVPDPEILDAEVLTECLSCGTLLAPSTIVCPKCGLNSRTGQKEAVPLADEVAAPLLPKRRQIPRWISAPSLAAVDVLVQLVFFVALLAGIAMTIVHVCRSRAGFSFAGILPMIFVLFCIVGITAPLSAWAVNLTLHTMKLAPRRGTYIRIVLCMLFPLSLAMIAGWPEFGDWQFIGNLGWPLAVLLFLLLFRAEVFEWLATVLAAVVAASLSLIVLSLAGAAVNDVAGGLYADMLPDGPWLGLAKGHSPVPPAATRRTAGSFVVTTAPTPVPTNPVIGTTLPAPLPSTTPDTLAGTTPLVVATQESAPATQIAAVPPTPPAPPVTPATMAVMPPTTSQEPPPVMTSPFFASLPEDAAIASATGVVAPITPGDWMLTLKNIDTTTEIDRWSLNPLKKMEHYSRPYYARKPAQFALSTKGDEILELSFFPRRQLQDITTIDNRPPRPALPLDVANNIPNGKVEAIPVLLGITDPIHYYLRWDLNGESAVQIFGGPANGSAMPQWRYASISLSSDNGPPVIAPAARLVAVFGRNQVSFGTLDGTAPPRPIPIASNATVQMLGMTFSPDGAEIAVYAAIADSPIVQAFQVKTGAPIFTNLLSQAPFDKDTPVMPHAVVWLPGAQCCLINGNELVDAATGRKIASLGLTDVLDAQVIGPSMAAFTFKMPGGTPHTILAKFDDARIRAAKGK